MTTPTKDMGAALAGTQNVSKGGTASRQHMKTYVKDCAILLGDCGPVIASGKLLGFETKLQASFGLFKPADADPLVGFQIRIPLSHEQIANEASGFGACHDIPYRTQANAILATEEYTIEIRFPRSSFQARYEEAPATIMARFPDAKNLTYLFVCLGNMKPIIVGYGRPFSNVEDPQVEAWVNKNKPLLQDCTLHGMLQLEQYHAVLPIKTSDAEKNFDLGRLPEPFRFPYGPQKWDVVTFKGAMAANPGHRFLPNLMQADNGSLLVSMAQTVVQDVMRLDDAAQMISKTRFPGYFVPAARDNQFYVVAAMPLGFSAQVPWLVLSGKAPAFNLHVYSDKDIELPVADWDCQIIRRPNIIDELANHPIKTGERAFLVRRPEAGDERDGKLRGSAYSAWFSLEFDAGLLEAERQVKAISNFHIDAEPTNVDGTGLPLDPNTGRIVGNLNSAQCKVLIELCDRMSLHREVLRGAGFHDWMTTKVPKIPAWAVSKLSTSKAHKSQPSDAQASQITEGIAKLGVGSKASTIRPLPSVDFLDVDDLAFVACIVQEAFPQDRVRFREYLSNRPLGLGLIGTGSDAVMTNVDTAATLAMQAKLGKILCSGPTDISIDNFADHLAGRDQAITDRCNQGKPFDDASRRRYTLIIRGYNPDHETSAIANLLRNPSLCDEAAPSVSWKFPSCWKLNLSCTFWLLLVLRSPAVGRTLLPDDPKFLHDLQKRTDGRSDLLTLRQLATGAIAWAEFTHTTKRHLFISNIQSFMRSIIDNTDILCITPSASQNYKDYLVWKLKRARGIAVDEASCLSRGDLCCVWGNTLLPCLLFGDPQHQPAAIMSEKLPDTTNHWFNRFSLYGKVSAMGALVASGLPAYRVEG
ncbi:hypothetical protein FGRMN_4372 [Fusarium graminum]|nr:hypothetical protein FGRMN_4372 [Fusarium graminum]